MRLRLRPRRRPGLAAAALVAGCCLWPALLAGGAGAARAQAVVVDFEVLGPGHGNLRSYTEDGFTFTSSFEAPDAFTHWATDSPNFAGSVALFNDATQEFTTLARDGGLAFSLTSIDLAELFSGTEQAASVTFVGSLSGGGTVSQTFTLDGVNTFPTTGVSGFQTFAFGAGFADLASVTWQQGDGPETAHQFDNVRLGAAGASAVPAPPGLVVAGIGGLIGLVSFRRRRRRGKAATAD